MEEQQDKRVTQYLIPANVTTKFEFFEGFGWYEFKIVLIALLIGTAFFFALGLPQKTVQVQTTLSVDQTTGDSQSAFKSKQVPIIPTLPRALLILIPGVAAFFIVKRNPSSGMSLMITIRSSREFKQKQKLYLYKYKSGSEDK